MEQAVFQVFIQDILGDWDGGANFTKLDIMFFSAYFEMPDFAELQATLDKTSQNRLINLCETAFSVKKVIEEADESRSMNWGKTENNRRLASLIAVVSSDSEYDAICLTEGWAHGYTVIDEITQTKSGDFIWRAGLDTLKDACTVKLELDLAQELHNLRREQPKLRTTLPWDDNGGRYATMFIATRKDGEWLCCQPPLRGTPYKDTAINRIYKVIFG